MGLWEKMDNPDFIVTEFSNIKNESGSNGFVLSAKQWIEKSNTLVLLVSYFGVMIMLTVASCKSSGDDINISPLRGLG